MKKVGCGLCIMWLFYISKKLSVLNTDQKQVNDKLWSSVCSSYSSYEEISFFKFHIHTVHDFLNSYSWVHGLFSSRFMKFMRFADSYSWVHTTITSSSYDLYELKSSWTVWILNCEKMEILIKNCAWPKIRSELL